MTDNSAQFDRNTLAAVKPGLDSTLADIIAQMELFLAEPANNTAALTAARTQMHSMMGVLKMAGLDGLAVFCSELDVTLGDLAANPEQASTMHRDVIRRALFGITHYLDALDSGADNATLRLFQEYQELQQLRGLEMSFELDLFYPALDIRLPPEILNAAPQSDAMARLKVLRAQFQQGLLKWMRQEDIVTSVQQMQQALDGAMRCAPQDISRGFWWVGCGVLECLKQDALPPDTNIRKLLSRIDQQLRAIAEGAATQDKLALNEMLFLVGRCELDQPLINAIKEAYALGRYLPEPSVIPPGEINQLLGAMRDHLLVAEESWELCAKGDSASCEKFTKYVELLVDQGRKLDNDALLQLIQQIQELAQQAKDPDHAQVIAVDMAMTLLLLASGIENYNRLGSGFQEQARILSERMQAAVKQLPEDAGKMTELVGLHYEMEHRGDVMGPLANEMLVNLQHVEDGLNTFFGDATKREGLIEILRLLGQIQGGLRISALTHAEKLLTAVQEKVRHFSRTADIPKSAERYALADALSALENYMQRLTHGQAGDVWRLKEAMAEMDKLTQPPAPTAPVPPPAATAPATAPPKVEPVAAPIAAISAGPVTKSIPVVPEITPLAPTEAIQPEAVPLEFVAAAPVEPQPAATPAAAPPPVPKAEIPRLSDEELELLEIFLEEAQGVVDTIASNLKTCQAHPDNHEAQVAIRRGFHTLKGSGRMVGLNDLGEVAWSVESAMNKWLQENKPATHGLLHFIEAAVQSFAVWVEMLRSQGGVLIEADDLVAAAKRIENGEEPYPEDVGSGRPVEEEPSLEDILKAEEHALETKPAGVVPIVHVAMEIAPAVEEEAVLSMEEAAPPESEHVEIPLPEIIPETPSQPVADSAPATLPELAFDLEIEPVSRTPEIVPEFKQEEGDNQQPALSMKEAAPPEPEHVEIPLPEPAAEPVAESAPATLPELAFDLEIEPTAQMPESEPEFKQKAEPEQEVVPMPELAFEPSAPPVEEEAKDEGVITIAGGPTLSVDLFNIASTEAMQNVMALHQQFSELRASAQPVVQYDFMRAAHTLSGVSRTMGIGAIVELAAALEGWLEVHVDRPLALREDQVQMVDQSIEALAEMVQNICEQQMPQPRQDLVKQLHADREKIAEAPIEEPVQAEDAPSIETMPEVPAEIQAQPAAEVSAAVMETPPVTQPAFEAVSEPEAVEAPPVMQPLDLTVAKVPEEGAEAAKPQVFDDIDEQLLPVFLEEAEDLAPKIGEGLAAWRENPTDEQQAQLLKRLLHTMKGSSRMVGAMRIGEIAHEMEDQVLEAAQKRNETGYWEKLETDFSRIAALLEELKTGKPAPEPKPVPQRRASDQPAAVERRADRRAADLGPLGSMLRVRSDVVDRLVNEAGEISVIRSRMEAEMRSFKDGLVELTASVSRLRQQVREIEIQAESQMQARVSLAKDNAEQFDPLEFDRFTRLQELTRFMNESVHDVQTIQQSMLRNLDETAAAMLAQGRTSRDLQQRLMNVRMVSFNSIADRLYRIVRQTGKELNKRANLELIGANVELDRSVLEKMIAPFEHLLRNSFVHGLEDEQQRTKSGKLPIGEIRLSVRQEGNEVMFEFTDDGAGLNYAKLREKGIKNGVLQPDEEASEDKLAELIFMHGLSTASEITEIAGRGVGMDVVRSEITALGGRIEVSSKSGQGTRFTIYLPLTLAVTQIFMVRSGDMVYAVPSTMVEQVRQVKAGEMEALSRERQVEWQGNAYPLHYLSHLLGNTEVVPEDLPRIPLMLLHSGTQRIALRVDEMLGNQEAMVKNIGPQLARMSGIVGATILGTGRVVLILNPTQYLQRIGLPAGKPAALGTAAFAGKPPSDAPPLIMVVDDSLTVRKITSRMLTRAGYQVVTATDGVDALEKLAECEPQVMLLDIEMPRMDGFALAKELRRDPKTKDLPIIMITSRTADKHRDYAMQLGVNTYLGKPYQEDDLLQNITDFVAKHK